MRLALERRSERNRRRDRMEFVQEMIKAQSTAIQEKIVADAQAVKDTIYVAATLIEAAARGFLGRLIGDELRLQNWAAKKVRDKRCKR